MRLSQPMRTLLLAGVLITVAVAIRDHFESNVPPSAEEEATAPVIRVARDDQPTIVESNENWLENVRSKPPVEGNPPLEDPQVPDLFPTHPAIPDTHPQSRYQR